MNDVEKEALQNLSIWSMYCNILACTRLGKHKDAEEDTEKVEHSRSGNVLILEEVVLPLVHHVPMPQNQ